MSEDNEFSPIADRGEMPRGRFGRRRGSAAKLPPLGTHQQRVFLDADGMPIDDATRSAGERYWAGATTWATVDLDEHPMTFELALEDETGRAGFLATITVSIRVNDAATVIRSPIGGVAAKVSARVQQMLDRAIDDIEIPGSGDPVVVLAQTHRRMSRAVGQLVGQVVQGLPLGLTGRIDAVSLAYDAATNEHREQMIGHTREVDAVDLTARADHARDLHEIQRRRRWSEYLMEDLSDPSRRVFAALFADPSPERIQATIEQVSQAESEEKDRLLDRLEKLVSNDDMLDREDEHRLVLESIASTLEGRRHGSHPTALESASEGELPASTGDDTVDDRTW